jgi:hypothetical protein
MQNGIRALKQRVWTVSVALGFAVLAASVYLWRRRNRFKPSPLLRVAILTKNSILKLLTDIREAYSLAYLGLRRSARIQRRPYQRDSPQYRATVIAYHKSARELLRKISQEMIQQRGLSESMVISSFSFYEEDEDIEDLQGKLGVVINEVPIPSNLTVDVVKDIYTYCHDRLSAVSGEAFEDYAVRSTALEDELWEKYGFEAEEIERAYAANRRELSKLETQFKLQGCFSFTSSLEDEEVT